MAMKFNDFLFNELKKLTSKPLVIPAQPDLESILKVCEQRSDRSRKDAFNNNCIVDGIPFTWEYTIYDAIVNAEDPADHIDDVRRVLTFPMVKRTTGWQFFLDIEECGSIYISEGKGTNRTRISLRDLGCLHWGTRKLIADTIHELCSNTTPFDFCKSHGGYVSVLYSYLATKNTSHISEMQECRGFKKSVGHDCDKILIHEHSGNEVVYILKCHDNRTYYYRLIKNGDIFYDVEEITSGCEDTNGRELVGLSDVFLKEDKEDLLSILRNLEPSTRGFLDYRNKMFYEHWKDIPEDDRPEIFIKDTSIDKLCQPCFNDIEDIDLENDKVTFSHDHRYYYENPHD